MISKFIIPYSSIRIIFHLVNQLRFDDVSSFFAGLVALTLFVLSLYAWSRSKQPSLIIVSVAFFIYVVKEWMELIPIQTDAINITQNILDFVILVTFFIAIIIGPRIRGSNRVRDESRIIK